MNHKENPILRFYCLSSGKVHTIYCPGSRFDRLEGPACRYLLAYHWISFEMYLLNPLTNDQFRVPSVNVCGFPDYIGPDPTKGGNIVVISGMKVYFDLEWKPPQKVMACWRPQSDDLVYLEGAGCSANAYYMQYFSNDEETGITNVIDIATKKLAYQVAPPEGTNPLPKGCIIMVESGGKILRLFHHSKAEPCHFDIYCLYFGDGERKPCWVKTTYIGDQMLFLQGCRGLSFCASNFAGFKGNCIYFLNDRQHICRYDIGDGTTEMLPCPFDLVETWFVPSLV